MQKRGRGRRPRWVARATERGSGRCKAGEGQLRPPLPANLVGGIERLGLFSGRVPAGRNFAVSFSFFDAGHECWPVTL
jgi:hypothetical protein